MADPSAIHLVADLLAAIRDAHTPRAIVRAVATSLSSVIAIRRVELRPPSPLAIAELSGGSWRSVDPPLNPDATLLAPGLAVVPVHPLPGWCSDPELRAVLAHIVEAAARHADVIHRLATLSRRAHAETRELRADLDRLEPADEIIARSPAMRDALARAELVARHPTTVLLTGESGSGKEVLAREIHRRSPRARRPLIQLNCGAIPESLVETELFGHERGAFTGADRARAGMFERAHRGTLFLDEVGELPPAAQVKLLRVLQERQLHRVGGTTQIDVDVRVLAATNRPLAAMVADGRFREDLYYRLDVFSIHVPPLRERRRDLAPLATALLARLAARLGNLPPPPLTRPVLARLEAHDWPGNVRELLNVLESALILGSGRTLELPDSFPRRPTTSPPLPTTPPRLDAAIRASIESALRTTRGKLYGPDGAAALLGLPPATLQSKMRKLGIQRTAFCPPGPHLRRNFDPDNPIRAMDSSRR